MAKTGQVTACREPEVGEGKTLAAQEEVLSCSLGNVGIEFIHIVLSCLGPNQCGCEIRHPCRLKSRQNTEDSPPLGFGGHRREHRDGGGFIPFPGHRGGMPDTQRGCAMPRRLFLLISLTLMHTLVSHDIKYSKHLFRGRLTRKRGDLLQARHRLQERLFQFWSTVKWEGIRSALSILEAFFITCCCCPPTVQPNGLTLN